MQKNSQNFSIQAAMRAANSEAGQQLLALLKQNNPDQLQKALSQAASGDQKALGKTLSELLSSPEAQALVKQLGGGHG